MSKLIDVTTDPARGIDRAVAAIEAGECVVLPTDTVYGIGADALSAAAVPLSSVRQPRAELGASAAELLFEEIQAAEADGPHEHRAVRMTPELIVRQSSAYQIVT